MQNARTEVATYSQTVGLCFGCRPWTNGDRTNGHRTDGHRTDGHRTGGHRINGHLDNDYRCFSINCDYNLGRILAWKVYKKLAS